MAEGMRESAPATRKKTSNRQGGRTPGNRASALPPVILILFLAAIAYAGWSVRGESHLTPEYGLGYALGIVGGSLMLLLLLYPLRKKLRFMGALGPVRYWFRIHMAFGLLGPMLILFHANFKLGSLNSNVALGAMLLVAGSGLVGRYFYSRIHHSLYGRRATLKSLGEEVEDSRSALGAVMAASPKLKQRLRDFEEWASPPSRGLLRSMARLVSTGFRIRWMLAVVGPMLIRHAVKEMSVREGWTRKEQRKRYRALRAHTAQYLIAIRMVAEFSFYERLFSLWHVLHLPLFLMLLISGAIHVLAVHFY